MSHRQKFWVAVLTASVSVAALGAAPQTTEESTVSQKSVPHKHFSPHAKRFHFGIDWTHSKWFVALDAGPVSALKRVRGSTVTTRDGNYLSPVMRYDIGSGIEYPQGSAGPGLWLPSEQVEFFYDFAHANRSPENVGFVPLAPQGEDSPELANAFWLDDPIDVDAYRKAVPPEDPQEAATSNQAPAASAENAIELLEMGLDNTVPSFIAAPGTGVNYALPILEKNLKVGMVYRRSVLGGASTTVNSASTVAVVPPPPPPPPSSLPGVPLQSSEFVVKVVYDF